MISIKKVYVIKFISLYNLINMRYKNISEHESNLNKILISRGFDPISLFFAILFYSKT